MSDLSSYVLGGLVAVFAANSLYVDAKSFLPRDSLRAADQTIVNRTIKSDRLIPRQALRSNTAAIKRQPESVREIKDGCDPAVSPLVRNARADIGLRCIVSLPQSKMVSIG